MSCQEPLVRRFVEQVLGNGAQEQRTTPPSGVVTGDDRVQRELKSEAMDLAVNGGNSQMARRA
jgi:hypothetical protein